MRTVIGKVVKAMAMVAPVAAFTGCASVTGSPNQNVSVQTRSQSGSEVKGVRGEPPPDQSCRRRSVRTSM